MPARGYKRLQNDERRALIIERATELFGTHGYEELSMAQLAREAKISKALLYHYFPSKRRLFEAALAQGAEELRARTTPDPSRSPTEQVAMALDAFLAWVEERPGAYAKLIQSAGSGEVRDLLAEVRVGHRDADPRRSGCRRRAARHPGGCARLALVPRRRDPELDRP